MVESFVGIIGIDFSRFSPQARIALLQAKEEARRWGHNYLGAEHTLLALAEGPEIDPAAEILGKLCVTPRGVRGAIEFVLGKGTAGDTEERPLNSSMARFVDIAQHQAWQSGQREITTVNLLLAITADGEENTARSILMTLGVLPSRIHLELVRSSPALV